MEITDESAYFLSIMRDSFKKTRLSVLDEPRRGASPEGVETAKLIQSIHVGVDEK